MTITCKEIDVEEVSGVKKKMQQETRVCKVCGNEANMIIDFGP
jgi:transcription elongation factor Elf1